MNCQLTIRQDFNGPTILELEPVLAEIQGIIEIRWEGTQAELVALRRHRDRHFNLIVADIQAMERAATATGTNLNLDPAFVESVKLALISRKGNNWRMMADDMGPGVTRALVTKLSADSIRRGNKPKLARITTEVICDGINGLDAEILLRLRNLRGSHV